MGEPKAGLAACGLSKIGRELSQVRGPNKAPAPSTESAFKEQVISYKKKEQVIQSLFNISIAQHTGVALQVEVFSAQQVSSIVSATIFFLHT
jgi:hypothetical protein